MVVAQSTRNESLFPARGRASFFALAGVVVASALAALSIFWDVTENDPEPESQPIGQFLVVLGLILVTTVVIHLVVVRRTGARNPGLTSLVLAIFGLACVVVFWSGLPVVLAAAAAAVAFSDRDRTGRLGGLTRTALVLAALTTLGAAALSVLG